LYITFDIEISLFARIATLIGGANLAPPINNEIRPKKDHAGNLKPVLSSKDTSSFSNFEPTALHPGYNYFFFPFNLLHEQKVEPKF